MTLPYPRRINPTTPLTLEHLEVRELLSGVQPTEFEQLVLERLNDMRADPAAYGQSIGLDLSYVEPTQPLAMNTQLNLAADWHSRDMNDNRFFGHVSSNGLRLGSRISGAGFAWTSYGESIAAGYATADSVLRALIIDKGIPSLGHRRHLLAIDDVYKNLNQVGVGIVEGGDGPYVNYFTIDTASGYGSQSFLTGAVFNDINGNGKYDLGESVGSATVTVAGVGSINTFSTGGYSFPLNPGTYQVTFSGGQLNAPVTKTIAIGNQNVRMNILTNEDYSESDPGTPSPVNVAPVFQNPDAFTNNEVSITETVTRNISATDGNTPQSQLLYSVTLLAHNSSQARISPGDFIVRVNSSDDQNVTLTIAQKGTYIGTVDVQVLVSDGELSTQEKFSLTFKNTTPEFTNPSASGEFFDEFVNSVSELTPRTITATDAETAADNIQYNVEVLQPNPLYDLDQLYQFGYVGTYYTGANNLPGKYIPSAATGTWYIVLDDGKLYPYLLYGRIGEAIADVGVEVYDDPSLLHEALPTKAVPAHSLAATIDSSDPTNVKLHFTSDGSFSGVAEIRVTAGDGNTAVMESFRVSVENTAPQFLHPGSNGQFFDDTVTNLTTFARNITADDNDGLQTLQYSAKVSRTNPLYELNQQYGFVYAGTYYTGANNLPAKYIYSTANSSWYVVMNNGNLHEYLLYGRISAAITNVGVDVYNDPRLLHDALPTIEMNGIVDAAIDAVDPNNVLLNLSSPTNYIGEVIVEVNVTDGQLTTTESFRLIIEQPTVTDDTLNSGAQEGTTNESTVDTAYDITTQLPNIAQENVNYSVKLFTANPLYELDQQYQFVFVGTYYTNANGHSGKYILSQTEGAWYVILQDGSLRKYLGGGKISDAIVNVGVNAYLNPNLLHEAQEFIEADVLTAQIDDSDPEQVLLTLVSDTQYTGKVRVVVSASSGNQSKQQSFDVEL